MICRGRRASGGWTTSLLDEGASCYVEQGRYGLPVKKATWLYACGVELLPLRWGQESDTAPGAVRWARVRYPGDDDRPRVKAADQARTPLEFRDALLAIARTAERVAA